MTIRQRQNGDEVGDLIPNLYATATSLLGLQIVIPDADADGRPERTRKGQAGAEFMSGQFGIANGGGLGSIWKIDGRTGEVSLFANVKLDDVANSGPGLGNIAFDAATRQLFVSDLDTGMIHRFDLQGNDLGRFDHGESGRPNKGLKPVSLDAANRMDITSATFDTESPDTWGFADKQRRVHGLAVHSGRLYYAVEEGPQIWSVGINGDGSFAADARWELDVKAKRKFPVTDIVFDRKGYMYLAQRGHVQNRYDYSRFAQPERAMVLRYWRETPDDPETESIWVEAPQEYAVGFPTDHRMTTGGIDIGYDYDEKGNLAPGSCDGMIAKTGDLLRENEEFADRLAQGGPSAVHGVQLTHKSLVRPKNVPPWESYFVDYDGSFEDPEVRGHIGDVEIWKDCRGYGYGEFIPYPGELPTPEYPGGAPCIDVTRIEYTCDLAGELNVDLYVKDNAGIGGDSIKSKSLKPGVSVSPTMQTRPGAASPFRLGIFGAFPNETFQVGVCFYNSADAESGGSFPCCKARIPLTTPPEACAH